MAREKLVTGVLIAALAVSAVIILPVQSGAFETQAGRSLQPHSHEPFEVSCGNPKEASSWWRCVSSKKAIASTSSEYDSIAMLD